MGRQGRTVASDRSNQVTIAMRITCLLYRNGLDFSNPNSRFPELNFAEISRAYRYGRNVAVEILLCAAAPHRRPWRQTAALGDEIWRCVDSIGRRRALHTPSVLPDISPTRGRWDGRFGFANL